MKTNYFVYFLAALLFLGCQSAINYEDVVIDDDDVIPSQSLDLDLDIDKSLDFNVTPSMAKYFAKMIAKKDVKTIAPIVSSLKDTVMYIINYNDGWLLLSGDTRTSPVLAKSNTGSFSFDEINPGVEVWLESVKDALCSLKTDKKVVKALDGNENTFLLWNDINLVTKHTALEASSSAKAFDVDFNDPLGGENFYMGKRLMNVEYDVTEGDSERYVATKWGQGSPWNTKVPYDNSIDEPEQCVTGCVAVAIAQMLHTLHYSIGKPTGLYHGATYSGYVNGNYDYSSYTAGIYVANSTRWDDMPIDDSGNKTEYVAELMAQIGHIVDMDYGYSGSYATTAVSNYTPFGITCNKISYNANVVTNQLVNNNQPVVVRAECIDDNGNRNGHAWIIDGYQEEFTQPIYTYKWELFYMDHDNDPSNDMYPSFDSYLYYDENGNFDPSLVYDVYISSAEATRRGISAGDQETKVGSESISYMYLMNWGWNGSNCDDYLYSPLADVWSTNLYDFEYNKKILYNFR